MVNNIPVDRLVVDDVPRIGIQLVSKTKPLGAGMHGILDIAPRLVELMLSAQEKTHVDLGRAEGAKIAWVETGYVDGLDRNMSRADRQRLMADGYAATMALLSSAAKP